MSVLPSVAEETIPFTFALSHSIQNIPSPRPLLILLDSGSKTSWYNHHALTPKIIPTITTALSGVTMAGNFSSEHQVTLHDLLLPELRQDIVLPELHARVFKAPCRYDMILGRDALRHFKIKLNFDDNIIESSTSVPMRAFPADYTGPQSLAQQLHLNAIDPFQSPPASTDTFALMTPQDPHDDESSILAADYKPVDIQTVVSNCTHLSQQQQHALFEVLKNFSELFNGKLKVYPDETIHLDIDHSVRPHRCRAYPIPHSQLKRFKDELNRLVDIGVLSPQGRSTWISGSFIIPKKDNTVRWISDFRALNKALRRKVYPIPRIQDILSRRAGYSFLTKLDISMQYYTFMLDDASKDLTTIATPFGLYKYNRLPMGVSQSPDIAQEVMEQVLRDINDLEVYIDDIACFSNSFDSHMLLIHTVLNRLQNKGFIINPRKCEWAIKETDFLGHWLTPDGVKPYPKKINAILAMETPKNMRQLRAFLGLVTYYRDMWPRRSHILAPLTELLKTPKSSKIFPWKPIHDRAFQQMKSLVQADTMLVYPDHNKPFHIETDASDFQLGAVIKQTDKPVAFYTRKLNPAQKNYTTIEKELLSVVETLKEFRSMLLGAELHVYTDHKNLTHKLSSFTTQRVLRWRLLLEEYNPTFHYIPGPKNLVADALSRTPMADAYFSPIPERTPFIFTAMAEGLLAMPTCDAHVDDSFLFHPRFDPRGRLPFHFQTINQYQQADAKLTELPTTQPSRYFSQTLDTFPIICRRDTLQPDSSWKIFIPNSMLQPLVQWYHEITVHSTGMDRLEAIIRRHFFHPNLRDTVRTIVSNCPICPQVRTSARQAGQLAPRTAPILPWHEVHVDFIGPWNVEVNNQQMRFDALTCIDPVTNLIEIIRLRGAKTADNARRLFENHWLARYPRPAKIVHDHGPEFHGHDFQFPLDYAGIKAVHISPNTPTANSIIEASHKTIGQVIRTLINLKPPTTQQAAEQLIDDAIGTAMHALRCNPVSTLGNYSPGALVFNRDMFLNIPLVADILTLTQHRQALIDKRLIRANRSRIKHEFKIGQQVFYTIPNRDHKLDLVKTGPFPILQVHTNNTVTIKRGDIHERLSIRHLTPFATA
jgi:transposase InsO family protein